MTQGSSDGLGGLNNANKTQLTAEEVASRLEIVTQRIEEKSIHNLHDGRHETIVINTRNIF